MTTRNRTSLHVLAVSLFSLGLLACGVPDTSEQACEEGPCLEGSSGGPWKKPLCREDADCGWDEESDGGTATPQPTYPVDTFNRNGGIEVGNDSTATGWTPVGCSWDGGVSASTSARFTGLRGLALTKHGCGVESQRIAMPDTSWRLELRFAVNVWGRPCSGAPCAQVSLAWFDATGARVGTTGPSYPHATDEWMLYMVSAARPFNATSVSVTYGSLLPDGQGLFIDDANLSTP